MNVRVELVAREVPAEAAGSSPRISGTGSKHTSRVTLGRTHFESNVKKCSIAATVPLCQCSSRDGHIARHRDAVALSGYDHRIVGEIAMQAYLQKKLQN